MRERIAAAASQLLRDAGQASIDEGIAIVPAGGASKVVYFATLLRSQKLDVAALLDSDQAGNNAAVQDDFVRLMPKLGIHRTKDHYSGPVGQSGDGGLAARHPD